MMAYCLAVMAQIVCISDCPAACLAVMTLIDPSETESWWECAVVLLLRAHAQFRKAAFA